MQRGRQMTALRGWCTSPSVTANPPFQSRQAQLESGVRGNVPAPFGAGERLQSPTYRYPVALGTPGRFAAFDDLVTLTVRAADCDERHGPFLPKGGYEDEAQCDSILSSSPLLKHYQFVKYLDHFDLLQS